MLDARQYREETPALESTESHPNPNDPRRNPGPSTPNTMIGNDQEQWLLERLASSDAYWNVLGNQIGIVRLPIRLRRQHNGLTSTAMLATASCASSPITARPTR